MPSRYRFVRYLRAVVAHTMTVVTGGAIAFLVALVEHFTRVSIPFSVYLVIVFVGVLWAGYKAWSDIEEEVKAQPRSRLVIHPEQYSQFYPNVAEDGNVLGVYLQFHISVENKGERHSNIRHFSVELLDTGKTYEAIQPHPRSSILTRTATHGVGTDWISSPGGIAVPGHEMKTGYLPFYLADQKPDKTVMNMRVKLRLADTEGVTTEHTFDLPSIDKNTT